MGGSTTNQELLDIFKYMIFVAALHIELSDTAYCDAGISEQGIVCLCIAYLGSNVRIY